jgi:hypothetical protein
MGRHLEKYAFRIRLLIYVSCLSPFTVSPEQEVLKIVETAWLHNEAVGIPGALAFSGEHFAQMFEGPPAAVDELLGRIEHNPRHTHVTILRIGLIAERPLASWSMAYSGPSRYVERHIMPLIGTGLGTNPPRVDQLINLLLSFAD